MPWTPYSILWNLGRDEVRHLANKRNLAIPENINETRSLLAKSYCGDSSACLGELRRHDLLMLHKRIKKISTSPTDVTARSRKGEILGALERILLSDAELEKHGLYIPDPSARDYQLEAGERLFRALRRRRSITKRKKRPVCLQLATGGGKTRIANNVIAMWLKRFGGPIIWISKDWWLLRQAAGDLKRRLPSIKMRRIGGSKDKIQIKEANDKFRGVVFTTLHTLNKRMGKGNKLLKNATMLVWDECHWGQHGEMGRRILKYCRIERIPLLGVTATPREDKTYFVAFTRTFFELVDAGWLAKPIIEEPVHTGVEWAPDISRGDFDSSSLRKLGRDINRNNLIVKHYVDNSHRYGQTLIFACDIRHANQLVETFELKAVTVAPVHSGVSEEQRSGFIQDFKSGSIRVLINVEMLTHGVDLPSVRTIFLCRPTTSDILFAQMVGRGSRLQEGKTDFHLVEFTDNVKKHGDQLVSSKVFFNGADSFANAFSQSTIRKRHYFDPNGLPVWIPNDEDLPVSVRGLWNRRGQTLGIEFELTHPGLPHIGPHDNKWMKIATELLGAIRLVTGFAAEAPIPGHSGDDGVFSKDCSLWNVEYDSSAGWEITSRILSDKEGYIEVDKVCESLSKVIEPLGLVVNFRTGTHIHLGWTNRSVEELKRVVRLVRLAEPALGTLVAPSRLVAFDGRNYNLDVPNAYCQPISSNMSESAIERWEDIEMMFHRYTTFNLLPVFSLGTVEVRMHSGTIEAGKILLWISLWQQILWAASVDREVPETGSTNVIIPNGDIVKFAREWLPDANEPMQANFIRRLVARRKEIVAIWRQNTTLNKWASFSRNWQSVD